METVHKVVLGTGKVVLLRPMKIKYQRLAAQVAGKKAEGNSALLGTIMLEEILKHLIVQIDGAAPEKAKLEALDDLFAYEEYMQLTQVLQKIMGGDGLGEFQTELVSIGG